jgi:hypothetical protein
MAQYEHLPIYRKAMDLTIYIENIVRGFSRYHKYTLGTDLRNLSREVVRIIISANSEKEKHVTLCHLRNTIEELKVTIRICKEVQAFRNFNSFKHVVIVRETSRYISRIKERLPLMKIMNTRG